MTGLVDRSWPLLRRLTGGHVALYRATGGRIGHKPPFAPPMLLLDHVGARSGVRRTSPLVYTRDGDDYVLVASKGGYPRHPAWLHNLRAHPDTTIQVGARTLDVHAHVASDEERARLWPKAVATYSGFDGYQARAGRTIPLVVLAPRRT
ncbi:MAG TPA: nitroreductase family deazaflavin-dependent oxidoreductase [Conexibacter sp.]|jgi:deazaflavin-dependent oxidoreductase (nitroreductase family)|nr:nitroreductase family deazaflavin-dependent oxidoreductase [Conexibacter sp.]